MNNRQLRNLQETWLHCSNKQPLSTVSCYPHNVDKGTGVISGVIIMKIILQ